MLHLQMSTLLYAGSLQKGVLTVNTADIASFCGGWPVQAGQQRPWPTGCQQHTSPPAPSCDKPGISPRITTCPLQGGGGRIVLVENQSRSFPSGVRAETGEGARKRLWQQAGGCEPVRLELQGQYKDERIGASS